MEEISIRQNHGTTYTYIII